MTELEEAECVEAVVDALQAHVVLTKAGMRVAAVSAVRAFEQTLERLGYSIQSKPDGSIT